MENINSDGPSIHGIGRAPIASHNYDELIIQWRRRALEDICKGRVRLYQQTLWSLFCCASVSIAGVPHRSAELWGRPEEEAFLASGRGDDNASAGLNQVDITMLAFRKKELALRLPQFMQLMADSGLVQSSVAVNGHAAGMRRRTDKSPIDEFSSLGFASEIATAAEQHDHDESLRGSHSVLTARASSSAMAQPGPSAHGIETARVATLGNAIALFNTVNADTTDQAKGLTQWPGPQGQAPAHSQQHKHSDAMSFDASLSRADARVPTPTKHSPQREDGTTIVSSILMKGKGLTRRYLASTHAIHTLLSTFGDADAALSTILTPITASMAEELFLFATKGSEKATYDDFVVIMTMLGTFLEPETDQTKGTADAVEIMCRKHFAKLIVVSSPMGLVDILQASTAMTLLSDGEGANLPRMRLRIEGLERLATLHETPQSAPVGLSISPFAAYPGIEGVFYQYMDALALFCRAFAAAHTRMKEEDSIGNAITLEDPAIALVLEEEAEEFFSNIGVRRERKVRDQQQLMVEANKRLTSAVHSHNSSLLSHEHSQRSRKGSPRAEDPTLSDSNPLSATATPPPQPPQELIESNPPVGHDATPITDSNETLAERLQAIGSVAAKGSALLAMLEFAVAVKLPRDECFPSTRFQLSQPARSSLEALLYPNSQAMQVGRRLLSEATSALEDRDVDTVHKLANETNWAWVANGPRSLLELWNMSTETFRALAVEALEVVIGAKAVAKGERDAMSNKMGNKKKTTAEELTILSPHRRVYNEKTNFFYQQPMHHEVEEVKHVTTSTLPGTSPSSPFLTLADHQTTAIAANGRPLLPSEVREAYVMNYKLNLLEVSDVLSIIAVRGYGLPGGTNATFNEGIAKEASFNIPATHHATNADLPTPAARYQALLWDLSYFFRKSFAGRSMSSLVGSIPPGNPAVSNFQPKVVPLYAFFNKSGVSVNIISGPSESGAGYVTDDPNLVLAGHLRTLKSTNAAHHAGGARPKPADSQSCVTIYGQNFPASGILVKYESHLKNVSGKVLRTQSIVQPSSRAYVSPDSRGPFVVSSVPIFGRDIQQFTIKLRRDIRKLIEETEGTELGAMLVSKSTAANDPHGHKAPLQLGASYESEQANDNESVLDDESVGAIVCYQREAYISVSTDGNTYFPFAVRRTIKGALGPGERPPGDLIGDPLLYESPAEGIMLSPAHIGRLQIIFDNYKETPPIDSVTSIKAPEKARYDGSIPLKGWARFVLDFGLVTIPPPNAQSGTSKLVPTSLAVSSDVLQIPLVRVPFDRYSLTAPPFGEAAPSSKCLPFNGFIRALIDLLVRTHIPLAIGLKQFLDGRQWLRMRENLEERARRGKASEKKSAAEEAALLSGEVVRDFRTLNLAIRRAAKNLPLNRRPSEVLVTSKVAAKVRDSVAKLDAKAKRRRRRKREEALLLERSRSSSSGIIPPLEVTDSDGELDLTSDEHGGSPSEDSDDDFSSPISQTKSKRTDNTDHKDDKLRKGPFPAHLLPFPSPRTDGIHPLLELQPLDMDEFIGLWDDPIGDEENKMKKERSMFLDGPNQRQGDSTLASKSVTFAAPPSSSAPQTSYPKGQWVNDWGHTAMVANFLSNTEDSAPPSGEERSSVLMYLGRGDNAQTMLQKDQSIIRRRDEQSALHNAFKGVNVGGLHRSPMRLEETLIETDLNNSSTASPHSLHKATSFASSSRLSGRFHDIASSLRGRGPSMTAEQLKLLEASQQKPEEVALREALAKARLDTLIRTQRHAASKQGKDQREIIRLRQENDRLQREVEEKAAALSKHKAQARDGQPAKKANSDGLNGPLPQHIVEFGGVGVLHSEKEQLTRLVILELERRRAVLTHELLMAEQQKDAVRGVLVKQLRSSVEESEKVIDELKEVIKRQHAQGLRQGRVVQALAVQASAAKAHDDFYKKICENLIDRMRNGEFSQAGRRSSVSLQGHSMIASGFGSPSRRPSMSTSMGIIPETLSGTPRRSLIAANASQSPLTSHLDGSPPKASKKGGNLSPSPSTKREIKSKIDNKVPKSIGSKKKQAQLEGNTDLALSLSRGHLEGLSPSDSKAFGGSGEPIDAYAKRMQMMSLSHDKAFGEVLTEIFANDLVSTQLAAGSTSLVSSKSPQKNAPSKSPTSTALSSGMVANSPSGLPTAIANRVAARMSEIIRNGTFEEKLATGTQTLKITTHEASVEALPLMEWKEGEINGPLSPVTAEIGTNTDSRGLRSDDRLVLGNDGLVRSPTDPGPRKESWLSDMFAKPDDESRSPDDGEATHSPKQKPVIKRLVLPVRHEKPLNIRIIGGHEDEDDDLLPPPPEGNSNSMTFSESDNAYEFSDISNRSGHQLHRTSLDEVAGRSPVARALAASKGSKSHQTSNGKAKSTSDSTSNRRQSKATSSVRRAMAFGGTALKDQVKYVPQGDAKETSGSRHAKSTSGTKPSRKDRSRSQSLEAMASRSASKGVAGRDGTAPSPIATALEGGAHRTEHSNDASMDQPPSSSEYHHGFYYDLLPQEEQHKAISDSDEEGRLQDKYPRPTPQSAFTPAALDLVSDDQSIDQEREARRESHNTVGSHSSNSHSSTGLIPLPHREIPVVAPRQRHNTTVKVSGSNRLYVPLAGGALETEARRIMDAQQHQHQGRVSLQGGAEHLANEVKAEGAIAAPVPTAPDNIAPPTPIEPSPVTDTSSSSEDEDAKYDSAFSMSNYLRLVGSGQYAFLAHTIQPYDTIDAILATYSPGATRRNILDANFLRDKLTTDSNGPYGAEELNLLIHGIPTKLLRIPVPIASAEGYQLQAHLLGEAARLEHLCHRVALMTNPSGRQEDVSTTVEYALRLPTIKARDEPVFFAHGSDPTTQAANTNQTKAITMRLSTNGGKVTQLTLTCEPTNANQGPPGITVEAFLEGKRAMLATPEAVAAISTMERIAEEEDRGEADTPTIPDAKKSPSSVAAVITAPVESLSPPEPETSNNDGAPSQEELIATIVAMMKREAEAKAELRNARHLDRQRRREEQTARREQRTIEQEKVAHSAADELPTNVHATSVSSVPLELPEPSLQSLPRFPGNSPSEPVLSEPSAFSTSHDQSIRATFALSESSQRASEAAQHRNSGVPSPSTAADFAEPYSLPAPSPFDKAPTGDAIKVRDEEAAAAMRAHEREVRQGAVRILKDQSAALRVELEQLRRTVRSMPSAVSELQATLMAAVSRSVQEAKEKAREAEMRRASRAFGDSQLSAPNEQANARRPSVQLAAAATSHTVTPMLRAYSPPLGSMPFDGAPQYPAGTVPPLADRTQLTANSTGTDVEPNISPGANELLSNSYSPVEYLIIKPATIHQMHATLQQRERLLLDWRELEGRVAVADEARQVFQKEYDLLAFAKLKEWSRPKPRATQQVPAVELQPKAQALPLSYSQSVWSPTTLWRKATRPVKESQHQPLSTNTDKRLAPMTSPASLGSSPVSAARSVLARPMVHEISILNRKSATALMPLSSPTIEAKLLYSSSPLVKAGKLASPASPSRQHHLSPLKPSLKSATSSSHNSQPYATQLQAIANGPSNQPNAEGLTPEQLGVLAALAKMELRMR